MAWIKALCKREVDRVAQYKCDKCGADFEVEDGMTEATCPKCGNVVEHRSSNLKRRIRSPKYQLGILLALLAIMAGVWASVDIGDSGGAQSSCVSEPGTDWIEYIGGEPRAADIGRVSFDLYQCNSDDTVRIVNIKLIPGDGGTVTNIWSPWFRPGDELLTVDFINAELIEQYPYEEEYYGRLDTCYKYIVEAADDHYGYDMLTNHAYLHIRSTDRLLSIGPNPQSYYAQDIIAVAVPLSANVTSIYNYSPYRHITLDDWDVFYYDVTDITSHVSIHIAYIPGEDAPPLNWSEVEALR
ncbi:MAG: zinc ribbon domain-containing protein [Chloroflexota bacterium]|nr:zinc ribbon domain-containing protein [Chloroflexota bacterium]